jgi:hypothetical protein
MSDGFSANDNVKRGQGVLGGLVQWLLGLVGLGRSITPLEPFQSGEAPYVKSTWRSFAQWLQSIFVKPPANDNFMAKVGEEVRPLFDIGEVGQSVIERTVKFEEMVARTQKSLGGFVHL